MSFFLFGPNADSWAIGNRHWTAHFPSGHSKLPQRSHPTNHKEAISSLRFRKAQQSVIIKTLLQGNGWASLGKDGFDCLCLLFPNSQNLPRTCSRWFEDQTLTALTIKWFSTGPGGLCCFLKSDGSFLQSRDANLLADTKGFNLLSINIQEVDQLSFSTGGGWFIRYTDGTVRLSTVGTFPQNFYNIADEYMQTNGGGAYIRQQSSLRYVFFGADGAVLVKLTNGTLKWAGLPDSLSDQIRQKLAEGWSLSRRSTLCQWNKSYYYLNWRQPSSAITSSLYNVKSTGILTPVLLREVAEGRHPLSDTTPTSLFAMATPETYRSSAKTAEEYIGFALWPFSMSEKGELTFEKWEQITDISRTNDDWYFGKNSKGETGQFPRQLVSLWTSFLSNVNCDICGEFVDGIYYHCPICNRGDFDICQICEEKSSSSSQCYNSTHKTTLNLQLRDSNVSFICADLRWQDSVKDGIMECIASYDDPIGTAELPDISLLNISLDRQRSMSPQKYSSPGARLSGDQRSSEPPPKNQKKVKENKYEKELNEALDGAIVTESPNVHWDDIAGLDQAKEELKATLILPMRLPHLFTGKRTARKGMLLYGPPGTGKSFLAKACATEIECTFFSISCSDIMSKWIGESERLVKQVFKKAREKRPSIIFIDEIDSMGGTRDSGEKHTSGMKTEFLVQMDGVGNDSNGVLVLAATNLPWKLDPALRRRFQKRIHIGLPDAKARARMFEIEVGDTPCELTSEDYENLGALTEGFSGSDIHIAVQDALMVPVKKISSGTHFRKITQDQVERFMPCAASDIGAFPMKWTKIPAKKILEPPLTADDFFTVITKSRPSVSPDEMLQYGKWTEDYGSEGA